jgi:anaerobic ribonucleoside-triphosphate reductase activating protein
VSYRKEAKEIIDNLPYDPADFAICKLENFILIQQEEQLRYLLKNIYINTINYNSISAGPGSRTELFMQGCTRKCTECFSPQTHNIFEGQEYTVLEVLFALLPYVASENITICGGEPSNQTFALHCLVKYLRLFSNYMNGCYHYNHLNILLYTGFSYKDFLFSNPSYTKRITTNTNMMVAGEYVHSLRFEMESFPRFFIGSSNQELLLLGGHGQVVKEFSASLANGIVSMFDNGERLNTLSNSTLFK